METWRAARVPALPGRGPEPHLANTATGELTGAALGPRATLYACGITPYDATHIGHAATYVAWDLLVRAWRDAGHEVIYVQNVTDVDDPLLERADRDGEDWRELADREIARYRGDMEALRVLPPDRLVGAVEALPLIDRMNQVLSALGALYEVDSDVYFSRASDPEFGAVSHLGPADMLALSAERGGDPGRPGKKDPLDCLVWLAARPGEPSWDSGFGPGRPGWHVECAAIATHYLGPAFDVQAGGSDLIFPHHECSASHARVAFAGQTQEAFARCYAHAGMVRLDGEKMSKSLGNLVFVSRLVADGVDPMAIRLAILSQHYRGDWDWTAAGLAAAQDRLAHWRAAVRRAAAAGEPGSGVHETDVPAAGEPGSGVPAPGVPAAGEPGSGVPAPGVPAAGEPGSGVPEADVPAADSVLAAVRERIADDLDAPGALAAVDRWASAVMGAAALPPGTAASAELVRDTVDALLGVAL